MAISSLCVFCGSRPGVLDVFRQQAHELGRIMAQQHVKLIYGGGKVGLMGEIADSVLAHKGEVIGIIPSSLVSKEVAHFGVSELKVVNSMHERKEEMYRLSNAFLALPGGFGTLDEFCEIFTWFQLGMHEKPIGFLNTNGFFDRILSHFQHSVDLGFVDQKLLDTIKVYNQASELQSFISCD